MTTITFYRSGGVFYGFEERGHTGYGEEGWDILCSALDEDDVLLVDLVLLSACRDNSKHEKHLFL